MKNIWRIFRSDWQRLTASVVAVVVVMGLSLVVCTAYLVDGSYNPFLYFRF